MIAFGFAACGREQHIAGAPAAVRQHDHAPKHGGTLAELGTEEFHLEFTFSDAPGVIQAYVVDGEVEEYIRIPATSFAATATVGSESFPLLFQAIASNETGETIGDTSLFEAQADWLNRRPALKIFIPTITIKGKTYTGVTAELVSRTKL